MLIPANNWFEWVKDPQDAKKKQPYCIRLKSQAPMFFAGLAEVHPGLEPHEGDGFVIITDAGDAGMVDIHDRRPLALAPEAARRWIEGDLPGNAVMGLLPEQCRSVADFEWYPVGTAVAKVVNQSITLLKLLD